MRLMDRRFVVARPRSLARRPQAPAMLTRCSSIGVAHASAGNTTWSFAPVRGLWAQHRHPDHRAVTDLAVQLLDEVAGEQPHLGGPGRRVRAHREHVIGIALGLYVRRDVGPDHLGPAGDDAVHGEVFLPTVFADQAIECGADRLRITIVAARTAPAGTRGAAEPPATSRPAGRTLGSSTAGLAGGLRPRHERSRDIHTVGVPR